MTRIRAYNFDAAPSIRITLTNVSFNLPTLSQVRKLGSITAKKIVSNSVTTAKILNATSGIVNVS